MLSGGGWRTPYSWDFFTEGYPGARGLWHRTIPSPGYQDRSVEPHFRFFLMPDHLEHLLPRSHIRQYHHAP